MKDCLDEQLSKPLINYFKKTNTQLEHSTHSASKNCMFIHKGCTDTYGKNLIKYQSTQIWNKLQRNLNLDLLDQSKPKTKKLIIEYFLKSYDNNQ